MAYEQHNFKPTGFKAAADLSGLLGTPATSAQFKAMKLSGQLGVDVASVVGASIVGVLQNRPVLGEAAEIVSSGITKAQADGAIAVNSDVSVSADGQFKVAITGETIVGTAIEPALAAGEVFTLLLRNLGLKP